MIPGPGETDERVEEPEHHHFLRTFVWIVVVGIIAAAAWLAYPELKQAYASLRNVPAVSHTVATLRDQVQQAEQKSAEASDEQRSALRDDAARLTREMRGRVDAASRRVTESTRDALNKLQERVDAQLKSTAGAVASLGDRVSTLESAHAADKTQTAELQQQIHQLQEQQNQQSGQLDELRGEVTEARSAATEQIAALQSDGERNQRDIATIAGKIATQKIPFEATKDESAEVAGGIMLHVTRTDVRYRRVSGWIWVGGDDRTIWLRNQAAQEPVIFYGYRDGARRELVITNVADDSVTGYLLAPKPPDSAASGE